MRTLNELIIHCSATREGQDFSAKDIDLWHRQRGFRMIGYHFVIRLDASIELGRPVEDIGAHTRGHNANSIGICYIGGLDAKGQPKDTRTKAQKEALIDCVRRLLKAYPSITKIAGHNEYAQKACPSFDVQKDPLGGLIHEKT